MSKEKRKGWGSYCREEAKGDPSDVGGILAEIQRRCESEILGRAFKQREWHAQRL